MSSRLIFRDILENILTAYTYILTIGRYLVD